MKYTVIAGKIEKVCSDLSEAKKFARRYNYAQIIDVYGFVRFIVKNYRVYGV